MERKVDEQGRITIPLNVRNYLGIEANDDMDIQIDGDSIKITPIAHCCQLCGSYEKLVEKGPYIICSSCFSEICK